jgi:hypothetical protein
MISTGLGVATLAKSFHGDTTTVDASEYEITIDNADLDVGMAGIARCRADTERTKIGRALSKTSTGTVDSGENNACESSLSAALSDVTTTLAGSRFVKVIAMGTGVVAMLAVITMVFTLTSKMMSAGYQLYQDILRPMQWFRNKHKEQKEQKRQEIGSDIEANSGRGWEGSEPARKRTNESGSQRINDSGSQRTNDSGGQRINESGSQRTNESGNQRTNDSGTNDSGNQRINDSGNQRINDSGSQRTNESGSQRTNESGSQRTNESGSQRTNDSGSQRFNESGNLPRQRSDPQMAQY